MKKFYGWLAGVVVVLVAMVFAVRLMSPPAHQDRGETGATAEKGAVVEEEAADAKATETAHPRQGGQDKLPEAMEKIMTLLPNNEAGLELSPDEIREVLEFIVKQASSEGASPAAPSADQAEGEDEEGEELAAADQATAKSLALAFLAKQTTDPIRIMSAGLSSNGKWMVQYVHDVPGWRERMPPGGYPILWVDRKTGEVVTNAEEAKRAGQALL